MNSIVLPNALMLGEVSRMLDEGHSVVIMTKGVSMLPFIRGGSDSVELVKEESYRLYDIVLAEVAEGHYVLHRIIDLDADNVTLKGDGNLNGVEHCRLSDIRGRAVSIIGRNGRKTDCLTKRFYNRSRRWRSAPYIYRRCFLAFYRRLIRYEDNRRFQNA